MYKLYSINNWFSSDLLSQMPCFPTALITLTTLSFIIRHCWLICVQVLSCHRRRRIFFTPREPRSIERRHNIRTFSNWFAVVDSYIPSRISMSTHTTPGKIACVKNSAEWSCRGKKNRNKKHNRYCLSELNDELFWISSIFNCLLWKCLLFWTVKRKCSFQNKKMLVSTRKDN